jgi:hypothetical protein
MSHGNAPGVCRRTSNAAYYATAFAVAMFCLLPRLFGKYYLGKYLWAEDGNIFLNQSQEMGLAAIIRPYNGYLHFFPRVIAEAAQLFSLLYQPTVLLAGWLLAYFIMVHALLNAAVKTKHGVIAGGVLVALVSLQPNYGEVFFNITNSQWMIGAALIIYALTDATNSKRQSKKGILLAPLALTGPFSIVLTPILLLRLVLRKDWASHRYTYVSVFSGALIQCLVMSVNKRTATGAMNQDAWEWIAAFLKIASFGANRSVTLVAAALLWILIVYLAGIRIKGQKISEVITQAPFLLLMGALLMILAGLFSQKHSPGDTSALGGGNRYTWVPYVLIVLSGFKLAADRRAYASIMAILFAMICVGNFHQVDSPSLQFEAFAQYAKVEPVYIPIHPLAEAYPGFYVEGKPEGSRAWERTVIAIDPQTFNASGLSVNFSGGKMQMKSSSQDPTLVTNRRLSCPQGFFAGLDVYLTREKAGWMQLFWSEDAKFSESASLRRWYPGGRVRAQFAFPMPAGGTILRFDPMEFEGSATIEKVELRCL